MNPGRTNTRKISSTDAAYEVTDTEFDADGTTLRGWVYRPRGQAAAAPAVVMAHGYNCIKELYLDQYAAAIAGTATGSRGRSWTRGCRSATTATRSPSCRRWTASTLSESASGARVTLAATSSLLARSTAVCAAWSRRCRRSAAGRRPYGGSHHRHCPASVTIGTRTASSATKVTRRKWCRWWSTLRRAVRPHTRVRTHGTSSPARTRRKRTSGGL